MALRWINGIGSAVIITALLGGVVSCEDDDKQDAGTAVSWSGFSWDAQAYSEGSFSSFSISAKAGHTLYYNVATANNDTNATYTIRTEIKQLGQVVYNDEFQNRSGEADWYYFASWGLGSADPAGTWTFTIYRDNVVLSQADITANP